jgi:hypothetical protein
MAGADLALAAGSSPARRPIVRCSAPGMLLLASDTLLPPWLVLPITGAAMLVIAGHILAMQQAGTPGLRLRIRTANGFLMMVVAALLGYALSIMRVGTLDASGPGTRDFVLVWMFIMGLLPLILLLAAVDVCNSLRLHIRERREIRREFRTRVKQEIVTRRAEPGRVMARIVATGERDERPV